MTPKVSVGLPVYNGERFLEQALDSLLSQTFTDFELIVSDNASTDGTEAICRTYVERDARVRYHRNARNLGVNANYRCVFELSSGAYFKWAAHDDLHMPDFLRVCVEILDKDPLLVVCYSRARIIDERGTTIGRRSYGLDTATPSMACPQARLAEILAIDLGSPPIYGVIRADVLRRTGLIGGTYAADQVLVAELALHGRFHEVPDDLFVHREHAKRSVRVHPTYRSLAAWIDPARKASLMLPKWELLRDYLMAIQRAPLTWRQRRASEMLMCRWVRYRWRELAQDLVAAMSDVLVSAIRGKTYHAD